ncbi:MAG: right-handed parallel beta-helix repeat-containing protein [Flavobacteriales bacterium]|nr:right-handed parallel beta-helix repeat-containing protein [Flavobacteriales bacterium]
MKHIALFLLVFAPAFGYSQTYDVMEYGAVGDGSTVNTTSIQAAIDDCNQNGGGEVLFTGGNYVSGTLILKSNVYLRIDNGAQLMGSTDVNDYPDITPQIPTYINNYSTRSLIYAEGQHHLGIIGGGRIDGQGISFLNMENRPFGIRFVSCQNVLIEVAELRSSGFWMMNNLDCDSVTIRNVDIFNHGNANNDGLNVDGCRNVLIENCTVDSNDDPLVLKTTGPANCENVEIRNCTVATWSRAIKIGTETHAGFKNIHIHDITVEWSSLAVPFLNVGAGSCGLNLAIVDGGFMENVTVENITMEGVETAIFVRLGNRGHVYESGMPTPEVGYLKDVVIRNVDATVETNITSSITGIPGYYATDILLENVSVNFPGGANDPGPSFVVPENEDAKPDNDIFGSTLPAYGLYVRHVDSLQLNNVCLTWEDSDARPGIVLDDVTNSPNYTVVSGNDGGCATLSSGIAENENAVGFWVDNSATVHIPVSASSMQLQVYNAAGQLVVLRSNPSNREELSLLEPGFYVAVLQHGNDRTAVRFIRG